MIKKAFTLAKVLIIVFLVSILFATPVEALPLFPNVFYGDVLVDGSSARDGLTITAAIAGVTFPYPVTTSTVSGGYGADFQFKVPADDADTTIKEGGVDGDTITFYVDGFVAGSTPFRMGLVTNFNLSIITHPPTSSTVSQGRRSLPDPSTMAMVGSGLAVFLFYIGLSGLRWRLSRS